MRSAAFTFSFTDSPCTAGANVTLPSNFIDAGSFSPPSSYTMRLVAALSFTSPLSPCCSNSMSFTVREPSGSPAATSVCLPPAVTAVTAASMLSPALAASPRSMQSRKKLLPSASCTGSSSLITMVSLPVAGCAEPAGAASGAGLASAWPT